MKMPVMFVGHGSPMIALEDSAVTRELSRVGKTLPEPHGILAISAHWYRSGQFIQSTPEPRQIYDMYKFPEALYQVKYEAKGSLPLTERVAELLGDGVNIDDSWGIDHGSWTVLVHLFPGAPYPVVQLSVNASASPSELFAVGRTLKPLRDEGWLILGSGNIVHNLRRVEWERPNGTPEADAFDAWVKTSILSLDYEALQNYRSQAEARYAVPTPDHFNPLFYVLGAVDQDDNVQVFNDMRLMGSLSMTSYLFG